MNIFSCFARNWSADEGFNRIMRNLTPVKNGQRDEVKDCQIDAQNSQEEEKETK